MLNSDDKAYDWNLPIMLCRFSNEPFALKKYRILHIENLTSNKKFGYQTFNECSADKLNIACSFEIKKKIGVRDVNFKN